MLPAEVGLAVAGHISKGNWAMEKVKGFTRAQSESERGFNIVNLNLLAVKLASVNGDILMMNLLGLIVSSFVLVVLARVVAFSEGMLLAKVDLETVAGRVSEGMLLLEVMVADPATYPQRLVSATGLGGTLGLSSPRLVGPSGGPAASLPFGGFSFGGSVGGGRLVGHRQVLRLGGP